jgi:lysophospholipase L1-like esterase
MTPAPRASPVATPAPPRPRPVGARVALVAGGVALGLLLGEAGLRAGSWIRGLEALDVRRRLAESEAASFHDNGNFTLFGLVKASPFEDVVYELKPGLDGLFHRRPMRTNRWGMRSPPVELHKPRGVFRIAGVGDSLMFGWGVGQGEPYLDLLRDLLDRRTGGAPRIETLNFAVPGYNTALEAAVVERRALAFDPDLLLVHFFSNDYSLPHFMQPPAEALRRPRSYLLDLVRAALGRPPPEVVPELYNHHLRRLEREDRLAVRRRYEHTTGLPGILAGFDRIARAAGARRLPVVVLLADQEAPLHRDAAREARARGFEVIDAHPYFRDHLAAGGEVTQERWRTAYRIPGDGHPTAEAHAVFAEALADALWDRGLVPAAAAGGPAGQPLTGRRAGSARGRLRGPARRRR